MAHLFLGSVGWQVVFACAKILLMVNYFILLMALHCQVTLTLIVKSIVDDCLFPSLGECTGFTCHDGECVGNTSLCDNMHDCSDGSDEVDCCE